MGRAEGRKGNRERTASPWPATGEDAEIGASPGRTQGTPSDIPGGRPHISNAPAHRQIVPTPISRPEVRGVNAHGVHPGTFTTRDRADLKQGHDAGRADPTHFAELTEPVVPVPVFIVESGGGPKVLRSASTNRILVNAVGGEPVRVAGLSPARIQVGLLNEDTGSGIRIGYQPGDLAGANQGALLMKNSTSYTWLRTQDELWAICDNSGPAYLSVIQEFERAYG